MRDEEHFAKIIAETLQQQSDRAESPAIVQVSHRGSEVRFLGIPGKTYSMTIREVA